MSMMYTAIMQCCMGNEDEGYHPSSCTDQLSDGQGLRILHFTCKFQEPLLHKKALAYSKL